MKEIKVSAYARAMRKSTAFVYKQIQNKEIESIIRDDQKYIIVPDDFILDQEEDTSLLKKELEMKEKIIEMLEKERDMLLADKITLRGDLDKMTARVEENNVLQRQLQNMLESRLMIEKPKKRFLFW